jgi:hypothetical protein
VAGGEITKAARNWIGNALDAPKRSQIMFMDRDDILNLYVGDQPAASRWRPTADLRQSGEPQEGRAVVLTTPVLEGTTRPPLTAGQRSLVRPVRLTIRWIGGRGGLLAPGRLRWVLVVSPSSSVPLHVGSGATAPWAAGPGLPGCPTRRASRARSSPLSPITGTRPDPVKLSLALDAGAVMILASQPWVRAVMDSPAF